MAATKSAVFFVTGGGRGYGRAVAVEIGRVYGASATVALVGRTQQALQEAAQAVESTGAHAVVHVADLSDIAQLVSIMDAVAAKVENFNQYTEAYLIQNAASLGDLKHTIEDYSVADIAPYVAFNITSPIILRLSKSVQGISSRSNDDPCNNGGLAWMDWATKRVIVNVSSLLAVKAFPYWGLYSIGKAARDQLNAVIALEGADAGIKTLNYAPGPMEGDMQEFIRSHLGDQNQRTLYADMHTQETKCDQAEKSGVMGPTAIRSRVLRQGKLVKMADSAAKLSQLLKTDAFQSGSHIDFFDL